nr:MAG TPA: tail protein [Caudoviricetes sp.]
MIYIATDNYNDGFPLSNAYDDVIYQKANAEYYLKFRFPVDRLGIWKYLTCETILKADDTRGLQLFKIKKINKINGYVRVYAKHITDDLNFIGVDKIAVSNATGRRVMEALAGSTTEQHNFIFNSDVATMHTLNLSNTTAGKVLSKDKHSILGQWGGELIRDNFLVDLKARAGVDTEILFMNKKNVKNLDNAISTENITTRLKLSVELEGEGNNKQTITATVDSPNINAYPRVYTNYLKVNSKTITTQEQLIEYGKKYFRDTLVDFPSDNLTVNVIDSNQERVNLFDTVWFRNVEFDIDKRLKVVAYEYSPMSKRYKKISFGALKVANFGQIKSLSQLEEKIDEKITESFTDAFKIQQNLSQLLKLDRKAIEDKMLELEEKSKGAVEVKRALFEADGTIPDVVKTKILDAVEGDIGRLKTIITEAELIKAIQAKLNFAEIKNALIDKAFINQIISDETFTQQFQDGQVTTQNIFTKLKDSIKSNILKEVVTKDGVRKIVNDLTVNADGIRQITQEEIIKRREELKGKSSYIHTRYSDNANGSNFDTNSNRKYIGVYAGEKEQAPTNASEYSWTKIRGEDGRDGVNGKSINENLLPNSNFAKELENWEMARLNNSGLNWQKGHAIDNFGRGLHIWGTPNGEYKGLGTLFNLVAKQGEKLTLSMDLGKDALTQNAILYIGLHYVVNNDIVSQQWQTLDLATQNFEVRKYKRISKTFTVSADMNRCRLMIHTQNNKLVNFYIDNIKLERGEVATEWSPAYEDLRGRDGVSNYIHRKYSDSSNGANMDDNSNRKYIGIYTGTSPTPPTTASSYLWSKIKGEDGANGVPGTKGADGRTPYFHTAYANSPTGDRDFSTTNSNDKLYIGTYSDFEVADSNDYRKYKWVKIKGEDGRNGNNGRDGVSSYIHRKYSDNANGSPMSDNSNLKYIGIYTGTSATAPTTPSAYTWSKIKGEDGQQGVPGARGSDGRTSYLHTAYSNSSTGDREFSTTNSTNKEYIGTYTDFEINDSNDYRRYKWIKIKGENGVNGRNGTDGHTLTANVRFEGRYVNNVTNNVKIFAEVYYDGQRVINGYNLKIKHKGGNNTQWGAFYTRNYTENGEILQYDWGNKEQNGTPLEVIVLVTYKGLNAVANARMENVPNVEEVKETIQRYRTFESTLNEFRSEIGYVKETTQILGDSTPDILKDNRTQTGNDVYFYSSTPLKANTWYTIVADISGLTAKQETGIYGASGNTKKPIMNNTNFWVVKYTSQQDRVNFYPLGTNTTIKNVKVYEGDFTETLQGNLYVTHTINSRVNTWLNITLNKNLGGKDLVLYFDVDGDVNNKSFSYSNALSNFSGETDVEFPLKNKDNVVSVSSFGNSAITLTFNYANPTIKNVRVYEVNYAFRKLTKTQTQNIGTVFRQSAEDIIVAWNNYNKYFSFNNESLDILEKDNYQNKYKKISLTSEGLKIYNNNTLIGTIGTFTHLEQKYRENTFDIVLTENTKAFGVYTWVDTWAFDKHLRGYMPIFEIKLENGLYKTNINTPTEINTLFTRSLNILEGNQTHNGVTGTINIGGRNLRFVHGVLVSG